MALQWRLSYWVVSASGPCFVEDATAATLARFPGLALSPGRAPPKRSGHSATRQKAPVITGKVALDRFDLGPIGKLLTTNADPNDAPSPPLGGEITGDITIEKIATNDLGHAKGSFAPKTLRLSRGGQRMELRDSQAVFTLADDTEVSYLVTAYYAPGSEAGIRYDDPLLGIPWPRAISRMSDKDRGWPRLA